MNRTFSGFVISGLFFLILLNACDSGFEYTDSGLAYKFHIRNDTALQADIGSYAIIDMKYGNDDTLFYDTKLVSPNGTVRISVKASTYNGDILEGLTLMCVGDSATFKVNADSFFLKTARYPKIPDYALNVDNLTFNVKLVNLVTQEEAISDYNYTESGLKYKFHVQNDFALQSEVGKLAFVNMNYGSEDTILYDTKVIPPDGLVPIPLEVPAYDGDFMEGIAMMHLGDSATFIVNSDSFFLKTARYPELPAYALDMDELTFNVKLVKIKTQQEARAEYDKQLLGMQMAEDSVLQVYLKGKNITTKPSETGLIYEDTKIGLGPLAKKGDQVTVNFSILMLDETEIFSTQQQGEPVFFELGQPFDTQGMDEALLKMREGGKARIIMPSNIAFGEQGRGNIIPPYTTLISDIELVEIKTKKEYSDEQQGGETGIIKKYLKDNGISASPTASGLYYVEREKGSGPAPQTGDKVKVWYTGKLVDGTVFDASENRGQPYEFALGQGRVIKGWDEGIALMKQGGKATLIIPSKLGYGERGSGQRIPPFSPLVFEVELREVSK